LEIFLSQFFSFSIEEINKEKHALSDTNESLSRDLTKLDADKFVISNSILSIHWLFSRTSIETDFRVEKDFRQRLQQALTSEKEKVSSLQFDMHELHLIKQVIEKFSLDFISNLHFLRNMIHIKKK
jgi:hypothetical protein